jgi:hypothetical protein
MTPLDWAVVLGGAGLVVLELWFFLGGLRGRNRGTRG